MGLVITPGSSLIKSSPLASPIKCSRSGIIHFPCPAFQTVWMYPGWRPDGGWMTGSTVPPTIDFWPTLPHPSWYEYPTISPGHTWEQNQVIWGYYPSDAANPPGVISEDYGTVALGMNADGTWTGDTAPQYGWITANPPWYVNFDANKYRSQQDGKMLITGPAKGTVLQYSNGIESDLTISGGYDPWADRASLPTPASKTAFVLLTGQQLEITIPVPAYSFSTRPLSAGAAFRLGKLPSDW